MIGAPRALYTPPLMGTQSNASSLVDTVNGRVLSSDRMLSIVPHKHCHIVQVTYVCLQTISICVFLFTILTLICFTLMRARTVCVN